MVVRSLEGDVTPIGTTEIRASARQGLKLDWLNGDVGELRSAYEQAYRIADADSSAWIEIGVAERRLRVLIHEPAHPVARDCAIIYFHGGGWIVGSPATHADISGALCKATGLRVYSVDYRLAPEHKAPAPVNDGLLVLEQCLSGGRSSDHLGSVILCGDSAGGAIAMAVERFASPSVRRGVAGVCSFYGGFGLIHSESMRLYGDREQGLDSECVERFWMLANSSESPSPYSISALQSDSAVPVYLLAGGRDPLKDDSLSMARALGPLGRTLTIDLVDTAAHGFLHEGARSPRVRDAMTRISAWIEEARLAHAVAVVP